MTSAEFISVLNQNGSPIVISDKEIIEVLNIQIQFLSTGVVIKNCIFKETVIFENADLNYGIKFIDCLFEKTLSLNQCIAKSNDHVFNFGGNHIEISNTRIDGLYFNGNNQIEFGVKICNKSIINKLKVNSLFSNNGSFDIQNSIIENQFDIFNSVFNFVEVTSESRIKARIRFENVSTNSLTFSDSTFEKDISIRTGKIEILTFGDSVFEDDVNLTDVPIHKDLTINGTEFKKSFIFKIQDNTKKGILKSVYIASGRFGKQFIINGNDTTIEFLTIDLSRQLEGAMYFKSCNLLKSKLSGDNYNSNIDFNHCNFNKLLFETLNNYSTISIISAKAYDKNSEITITNSTLGKLHFFNMFFNTFDKINISNSVLTEIVTANVKWFKAKNLNSPVSHELPDFAQKREIFRQLKYALEKQGNRIESLQFKSLEINAFKQELFFPQKWYKKYFNNDRFVLWIGQTNNFGLSWVKPVLFILGFGLLFYCLIVIGISEKLTYSFSFNSQSFITTFEELRNYIYALPQLMNPVHSLDKIFTDCSCTGFLVNLFDYMLKIFLAFFIFQIISAFRKFMK